MQHEAQRIHKREILESVIRSRITSENKKVIIICTNPQPKGYLMEMLQDILKDQKIEVTTSINESTILKENSSDHGISVINYDIIEKHYKQPTFLEGVANLKKKKNRRIN